MTGRELALRVLRKSLKSDAFVSRLLEGEFGRHKLSQKEKRLAAELAYGCLRRLGTLDLVIEECAGRKMADISKGLRDILRVGVYQLLCLDRVPGYAAVNETVELARAYGPPGSEKFVNAVLRRVPQSVEEIAAPKKQQSHALYLSIVQSHPLWLVERWLERWGPEETEALCRANNAAPPLTVRANTLRCGRDELIKKLQEDGVQAVVNNAHRLAVNIEDLPTSLKEIGAFRKGLFQVQDALGMRVVDILGARRGERVVDLCAAPGGKATAIAESIGDKGKVSCLDVSPRKLKMINQGARRLGIRSIRTAMGDGREVERVLGIGKADRVLVDAPCSNTGVFRRRPEARWRLSEADIGRLAKKGLELLCAAARVTRPNGVMVYSTCSIEPEENEKVVKSFLNRFANFRVDSEVCFLPHRDGCDGGYAARLICRG